MNEPENLEARLASWRPRRPSARLEARLFAAPAAVPARVPAAAWCAPAAAGALLLALLWPGWNPVTARALAGGFDLRDWRAHAATPVLANAVHRGIFPSTNAAAVPTAFASLLLGQTNFLQR